MHWCYFICFFCLFLLGEADEILSKLDYDEVKNKKIFQKFLALQQNGAAQPERTNFQDNDNDEHD